MEEDGIKEFLEDQIYTIAATRECEVLALEVMPDHVHLFISTTSFESPTGIVKVLKGVTALRLFKKFPGIRGRYWKGNFSPLVIMWGRLGMSQRRRFKNTSRSREGLYAIHPPIKRGGLLATI